MGAREVGCLPSTLAAHRDFSDAARASVTRFWSAPRLAPEPGLSGEALRAAISDGSVRALWMLGSPPPDLAWGGERPFTLFAGDRLPAGMADRIDIALPMASELERDGARTGVDRLIGRQRPVFPLPGDARPGWWIVTRIARAMGWHDAFHYERPADIYREHARLSVYQEEGGRLFDLRRHAPLSNPAYDELTPWRWGGLPFADGRFPTADGRARLIPFQAAAIP
jgi:assimilatory nitrate reductase catalytic subunit